MESYTPGKLSMVLMLLTEICSTGRWGPAHEDLLCKPFWPFARPSFQHFVVLKALFSPPNHKFLEVVNS